MRISDWSSDVCSSDLPGRERRGHDDEQRIEAEQEARDDDEDADQDEHGARPDMVWEICSRGDAAARREYPKTVCAELVEALRSEARRVGKECVSTSRYRGAEDH